jgi:phenylacetate-CoA ligase
LPFDVRYGKVYKTQLALDQAYEFASIDEIHGYQGEQLKKLIRHAYDTVPFYRKYYTKHGVSPEDVNNPEDIAKLPAIDKKMILEAPESFLSEKFPKEKLHLAYTSGTSGYRLGVYFDPNNKLEEWAHVISFWNRIGYRVDDTRVEFRTKGMDGSLFQYDSLGKKLTVNVFQIHQEAAVRAVAEEINRRGIAYFYGYMSSIYFFVKNLERFGLSLRKPVKAVLAVSEMVHAFQRTYVEKLLGTRVFSFYGHTERVIFAGECEISQKYHCNPVYGITEVLDRSGNPALSGVPGELVGTGFSNFGMPLIRYRTNDYASLAKQACSCGRHHLLLDRVYGRNGGEKLVTKSLQLVPTPFRTGRLDGISRFKLVQDKPGFAVLVAVPMRDLSEAEQETILKGLYEITGEDMDYGIELTDYIEVKGKGSLIEQTLDLDKYDYLDFRMDKCDE